MENSSYIKPYFYIEGDKVIYPASTWKRVGARFIDIFLVNILVILFFAILYSNISEFNITDEDLALGMDGYKGCVPQLYSLSFMLVTAFAILILIILNLIIPLFNKKNPGQTFGKLLFGITPIFFTKNNKKSILIREVPLVIIVIMPLLLLLIMGGNPIFYYSQAQDFFDAMNFDPDEDKEIIDTANNVSFYNFIRNYMTNPEIMPNGIALSSFAASFIYLKQIATGVYWIFLIALWVTIAFNHQKMGLMDKIANTSVVDLRKIIDRSLIEGDLNYVEDTTLNPKDITTTGPPVELNK